MKKSQTLLITSLFCLFLGIIAALTLLLPKKEFSEVENRYLQASPTFSWKNVFSGTLMKDTEDYISDHIIGRDLWVQAKANVERLVGKRENNGIYFGSEETLLKHIAEPSEEDLLKKVGYVNTLAETAAIPVYFGIVPTSSTIWSDRLPYGAPTADERAWIAEMYENCTAKPLDLIGALTQHAGEDIYYRTDHHWTSLGAFYGANALLTAMDLEPLQLDDYTKTTVSAEFRGTIWSSAGASWITPDEIDTYVSGEGLDITSVFNTEPEVGSLYHPEYLEKKDKYSYFLGGNQPQCVIRTGVEGPKLLMLRDSYSDSLAPFLTERFSEIHLLDLRYYSLPIGTYIEENGIDCAVVLYGFTTFSEDRNLIKMTR